MYMLIQGLVILQNAQNHVDQEEENAILCTRLEKYVCVTEDIVEITYLRAFNKK